MDGTHFDQLARKWHSRQTRRGALRRLAAVPLLGGLALVLAAADGRATPRRQKRRQARHRHRPGERRRKRQREKKHEAKKHKEPCPADAQVCASGCPFSSVQAAIDAAEPGATITICAGTFTENLSIAKDLRLVGAGQGDDPNTSTILVGTGTASVMRISAGSAELQGLRITGGNSPDIGGGINAAGSTRLTVTDCTITGNIADGFNADGRGGGIITNGDLTLTNCTITDNLANEGGGIATNGGTNQLTGTTISGNTARAGAGGIWNRAGTTTLTNCVVAYNQSSGPGDGGGVFNDSTLTLIDTKVSSNTSAFAGGGIANGGAGVLTLEHCVVSKNTSARGAITSFGALIVSNSTINDNTCEQFCGIDSPGNATVTSTEISGNKATQSDGAGLYCSGTMYLSNGRITGNTAARNGGGIFNHGEINLTDCHITGNTAKFAGGGIFNYGTTRLANTNVTGNGAGDGGGIYSPTGSVTLDAESNVTKNTAARYGGGIANGDSVTCAARTVRNNSHDNCYDFEFATGCNACSP